MPERIAAGDFGAWLAATRSALQGEAGTEVPCGDCVGCCVSSYHIPLRPADGAALERAPARFLSRQRQGSRAIWLMGYDPAGRCPLFEDGGCSIYRERPRTCRDYDCRVFAAAGIEAGGRDKAVINERVRAWEFSCAAADRPARAAVRRAARFIAAHAQHLSEVLAAPTPLSIAVLAVETYPVFLGDTMEQLPTAAAVRAICAEKRAFDGATSERRETVSR